MAPESAPGNLRPAARIVVRVVILALVLAALYFGGGWLLHFINTSIAPYYDFEQWRYTVLLISLVAFVLMLAIPFVPGMEIGLSLMMFFGVQGVAFVFAATLLALSLSFLVGRRIPIDAVAGLLGWLHLEKARGFAVNLAALDPEEKLGFLVENAPMRFIPFLLRHRYIAVAVALNVPGNWLIGGGGGIGLLAGLSGIFAFPRYLLATALAISPLPLLFLLGFEFLPIW